MIKKTYFLLLLFGLCISFSGNCQTATNPATKYSFASSPKIISYSREDFNSDPNFLTACENQDGTLVFGNNDGALYFDGVHWQKISLPNNSPVNSVIRGADGKIYVCGFNQFGTLDKNKYGQYFYKSLNATYHLEGEKFENLWQIRELKKHLIIRSFSKLVVIIKNKTTILPSNKSFIYSEKIGTNYFVQDAAFGIYKLNLESTGLSLLWDAKKFLNEDISCMLPTTDPNIITLVSETGTIYSGNIAQKTIQKKNNLFEDGKKDFVTCGIANSEFEYAIGTQSSKIIVVNKLGKISRDSKLATHLTNGKIHSLLQISNGNIWVFQNNALSLLDYKSPFICAFDQASVYDILVKNNKIYLATNAGAYQADFDENIFNFKKIENTLGQIWSIQDIDSTIIISHDKGILKLDENGTVKKINNISNVWKVVKLKKEKNLYLGANYFGLSLLEKKANNWSIKCEINGFSESSRDILEADEPNTFWVCHGYKGVYKIHLNGDYTKVDAVENFTNKNGFQSPYNINVFRWKNNIVFTSNTGIYTYDKTNNKFVPFKELNQILDPKLNTRKLLENGEKTWFVQDDEVGYFIGNNPKLYKDLFINLKGTFNRGMESIYPLPNNRVLLGTNNGLYLYYLSENKTVLPTIISKITYTKNQNTFLIETNSTNSHIEIPNETDLLRFEFASPKMLSSAQTLYSYKLENLDQNWSAWQKIAFKEYTHLNPGNYIFVVKSKNLAGLIGKTTAFEFTVLPKWYQTKLFYFFFIITTIFLIYQIIKYVRGKIALERLKLKLEFEKSRQLLTLELEKLKIRQEKESIHKDKLILEEDIVEKSKELANYTILLSQKKDLFDELKTDLKKLRDILKNDESRKKASEIFQKVNYHGISEEYMEIFDINFEKINHSFYEKLLKIDSKLTTNELRLCAFVKMNLSNKEIAPLLNISIRGVENARYKIRKKLNVHQELNFASFLNELNKNDDL